METKLYDTATQEKDLAVLVAMDSGNPDGWPAEDSLAELTQLAETAGAEVLARFTQNKAAADVAFYIGKGKATEVKEFCKGAGVTLVIFDNELSPRQRRNLEEIMELRVIDRTELILDIFAQRAQSKEGKLQVELAQLNYRLPRLSGQGTSLSRLGGGIGTRGPGESKLESDRRHIRARINTIKAEIDTVSKHRTLHRDGRREGALKTIAMVGYTNAGKSTLLNSLTGAGVLAEDKLFATLDPTVRKVDLPNHQAVLLSDTVGFIHNLPHHLVASFRATLEEVTEADLLLHVVDASHPKIDEQSAAVFTVLGTLGAADKRVITAFNKVDRLDNPYILPRLLRDIPDSVGITALTGAGLDDLLALISQIIESGHQRMVLTIPYDRGDLISLVQVKGQVHTKEFSESGLHIEVTLEQVIAAKMAEYLV